MLSALMWLNLYGREIFTKKHWELAELEHDPFFESAILNFCFIPMEISQKLLDNKEGTKLKLSDINVPNALRTLV